MTTSHELRNLANSARQAHTLLAELAADKAAGVQPITATITITGQLLDTMLAYPEHRDRLLSALLDGAALELRAKLNARADILDELWATVDEVDDEANDEAA